MVNDRERQDMPVGMVNRASLATLWLCAKPKPDQALLVSACEASDQNNPNAAALSEEPAPPLLSARTSSNGGK